MKDRDCKILKIEKIAAGTYSMWLKSTGFKTSPGQFAMVEVPGYTLRRPLAIASMSKNRLQFVFRTAGKGTKALAELKPGTQLKVLAPLGTPFPVHSDKNRLPVLVGGGTGLICIYSLAVYLSKKGFKPYIITGAKNKDELILKKEFSRLGRIIIATDDGSCGEKCTVAKLFGNLMEQKKKEGTQVLKNITVYSCGPHGMLEAIHKIASSYDVESYSSMEERMACGVGACVGCVVKTKNGLKRVCKDGPVFNSYDLFDIDK